MSRKLHEIMLSEWIFLIIRQTGNCLSHFEIDIFYSISFTHRKPYHTFFPLSPFGCVCVCECFVQMAFFLLFILLLLFRTTIFCSSSVVCHRPKMFGIHYLPFSLLLCYTSHSQQIYYPLIYFETVWSVGLAGRLVELLHKSTFFSPSSTDFFPLSLSLSLTISPASHSPCFYLYSTTFSSSLEFHVGRPHFPYVYFCWSETIYTVSRTFSHFPSLDQCNAERKQTSPKKVYSIEKNTRSNNLRWF